MTPLGEVYRFALGGVSKPDAIEALNRYGGGAGMTKGKRTTKLKHLKHHFAGHVARHHESYRALARYLLRE